MRGLYGDFIYPELDSFMAGRDARLPFVIFGAGWEGEQALDTLKHTKYASNVYGFCDNNKELWGKEKFHLPVFSPYELLAEKREIIYILASGRHNTSFLRQLLNLYVPQRNIFIAPFDTLFTQRGWQYFDMFPAGACETFVDAGAYDGRTSRDFIHWCLENSRRFICLN